MKLKKLMKKVLKRVHKLMAVELKRYQKEDEVLAEFDKCQGVVEECLPLPYEAIAYVDGSYRPQTNEGSYGIVFLINGDLKLYSKMIPQTDMEPGNPNTPELYAAAMAMLIASSRQARKLIIRYDFTGIKDWAVKPPRDNQRALWYRDTYRIYSKKMQIIFEKVKAHNGIMHNEIADLLAKNASMKHEVVN